MLMLLGMAIGVKAADAIVASDISIPKGGSAKLSVQLSNPDKDNYGGFQFDLQLPAGISATGIEQAARLSAIEGFTLSMNLTDATNNIYQVLGYNTGGANIGDTSGDIAYILLHDGTGSDEGATSTGYLKTVTISTTDATPVQTNAADASFTITIAAPLSKVKLSENSTTAPAKSSGAVDVTVERTIKANEWSTICLPFDMSAGQVKAAFGTDVKLKKLDSWSFAGDNSAAAESLTLGFTNATTIEKNVPLLIKVSSNISSFDVDGVEVDPEEYPSSDLVTYSTGSGKSKKTYTACMYGTYVKKSTDAKDMFIANNKFWYSVGSTTIKAFRATFWFVDGSDNNVLLDSYNTVSPARVISVFGGDDNTTDISNIIQQADEDAIYNLSGQRVTNPGKGIFIKNGKKIVIK